MKIKSLKAFAIVNKKKPKLNIMEIYGHKNLVLAKDEMIVKVLISVV